MAMSLAFSVNDRTRFRVVTSEDGAHAWVEIGDVPFDDLPDGLPPVLEGRVTLHPRVGVDGVGELAEMLRDVADGLEAAVLPQVVAAGLEIINGIAAEQGVAR